MRHTFHTKQMNEYLLSIIGKMPGNLPPAIAVEMFELILDLEPSLVVYDGDHPDRSVLAHGLGLKQCRHGVICLKCGIAVNDGVLDVVLDNGLRNHVQIPPKHSQSEGIDVLHLDREQPDEFLPMINAHGYIWTRYHHPSLAQCKLVKTNGDYSLYCNRPYH